MIRENSIDFQYKSLVKEILDKGYIYEDPNRKGVQRKEILSSTIRHEFKNGFPAITLKKLAWKSVVTELIWFLRGDTNIKYLVDNGCNIWNKDAYNYYVKKCRIHDIEPCTIEEFIDSIKSGGNIKHKNIPDYKLGDLGKVYGHYWRNLSRRIPTGSGHYKLEEYDQIVELIKGLKEKPLGTEHIVTARNPLDKDEQALPCCHFNWQIVMRPLTFEERLNLSKYSFNIKLDKQDIIFKLDEEGIPKYGFELHWKQRSVDAFLGLSFNIASYALLALILEKITGHKALAIQGDLKKVHLYDNSIEAAKELVTRECSEEKVRLHFAGEEVNQLIDKVVSGERTLDQWLSEISPRNFKLIDYNPQEPLKVEMLSRD